ncbi:unnamed protein product [Brassica rapa subsp. narinosa]
MLTTHISMLVLPMDCPSRWPFPWTDPCTELISASWSFPWTHAGPSHGLSVY